LDYLKSGITDLDSACDMDKCPHFFYVVLSYVGRDLTVVLSLIQGSLPNIQKIHCFKINSELEQVRGPNP